jgi:hypothetical protein
MIQAVVTFGTGAISLAVLVLVWKIATAFSAWTLTLKTLGLDLVRIEKNNASGHVKIELAVGKVDHKVDKVGDRVTKLESGVREPNETEQR